MRKPKPLTPSSFNKWRCLISLAHIDAKFQPVEKEFIGERLRNLDGEYVTEQQMNVLLNDLRNKKRPDDFFRKIESDFERIELLRMSYQLFWADGEFEDRERRAYQYIKSSIAKALEVDKFILDDIAKLTENTPETYKLIETMLYRNKNPLKKCNEKEKAGDKDRKNVNSNE